MPNLLLIDDEPNIVKSLGSAMASEGFTVASGASLREARALLGQGFDAALLDVWLPDGSGIELLGELIAAQPHCVVVMISGHAQLSDAVDATRLGAHDFLEKPLSLEKVLVTVNRGLELERLRRENLRLRQDEDSRYALLGESPAIRELLATIEKVAPADVRVLIRGESGSGKELVARQIHRQSSRAKGPFVPVNCAALPENLIESELFGFERGAFTGATRSQSGKFEDADRGTLFLDEIGDLPQAAQAKLLRVLEEGKVQRIGGKREQPVDVRLVAATHQDLEAMVKAGSFREDLLFRLKVVPMEVPPLRERPGDVELLAEHFLALATRGAAAKRLTDSARRLLAQYRFPGNVRELRNMMERAAILVDATAISAAQLKNLFPELASGAAETLPYSEQIEAAEREIVVRALESAGWNVSRAAELLRLERSHLHKKMKALGIQRPEST